MDTLLANGYSNEVLHNPLLNGRKIIGFQVSTRPFFFSPKSMELWAHYTYHQFSGAHLVKVGGREKISQPFFKTTFKVIFLKEKKRWGWIKLSRCHPGGSWGGGHGHTQVMAQVMTKQHDQTLSKTIVELLTIRLRPHHLRTTAHVFTFSLTHSSSPKMVHQHGVCHIHVKQPLKNLEKPCITKGQ